MTADIEHISLQFRSLNLHIYVSLMYLNSSIMQQRPDAEYVHDQKWNGREIFKMGFFFQTRNLIDDYK